MNNKNLLSKFVEKIELEILTNEECALIGGSADSINAANNCMCDGNNCPCGGNNCHCNFKEPDPGQVPTTH